MFRRRRPHGQHLLALAGLLAALVLPACGADETATPSAGGPDPATVLPAGAFLYAEVVVRPQGDVEAGARAALRKALRVQDPGAEIRRLIDAELADDGETFVEDVDPWLGPRMAVAVALADGARTASDLDRPDVSVVVAVRDRDELHRYLDESSDQDEIVRRGSYRGVAYTVDEDEAVTGVLGDFLALGTTMRAFRAMVDASEGTSLADVSRFEGAVADDALASLWFDPRTLARRLRDLDGMHPRVEQLYTSSRFAQADPITASLTADADEIAIEASGDSDLLGGPGDEAEAGVDVGELPGDAWLALATPPLGPLAREALDGAGIRDVAARQLRRSTGLDLERDLLDAIGGLGLFVRGTSPLAIGGGVLLRTTSDAGARRLVTLLQSIVEGAGVGQTRPVEVGGARGFQLGLAQSPQPIVVLAKGAEIAAGYAASSAQDLLDPAERLEDDSEARAAIDTLGEGFTPSFVLLVPPLADLLSALDQLEIADVSRALPYVNAYRSLAIGTQDGDDRTTVRIVATLR
jgi:hypothetical protein